jgi:hypothetical protein
MTHPALPEPPAEQPHTAHVLYPPQDPFAADESYPSEDPLPSGEPHPSEDPFASGEPHPSDEPRASDEAYSSDDPRASDEAYPSGGASPAVAGRRAFAPGWGRNNMPLVAVIVVASLLLCGGTVVTGVLVARQFIGEGDPPSSSASGGQPAPPSGSAEPAAKAALDTSASVVYEVTGDGQANITYLEESGIWTKTENNVQLPWRVELRPARVTVLSLVAIRTGTGSPSGKVACRALVDGREIVKNSGAGRFGTAACYSYSNGG